jgi:hypothetical protein
MRVSERPVGSWGVTAGGERHHQTATRSESRTAVQPGAEGPEGARTGV